MSLISKKLLIVVFNLTNPRESFHMICTKLRCSKLLPAKKKMFDEIVQVRAQPQNDHKMNMYFSIVKDKDTHARFVTHNAILSPMGGFMHQYNIDQFMKSMHYA